jgi:hypothetical protein
MLEPIYTIAPAASKTMLDLKVVKTNSSIIISLRYSKSLLELQCSFGKFISKLKLKMRENVATWL